MELAGERLPDADLGPLIARGRDAEVFALGTDMVVRRTAKRGDLGREARLLEHLRDAGYPVPQVHRVAPGEMVLERIPGPTMLDDIAAHPWRVGAHGRLLAALHDRLHAVPAPDDLPSHPWTGSRVLHLDLHPANIILSPDGPVVIDWTNARRGEGAADLADVWIVVACLGADHDAAPGPVEGLVRRVESLVRRRLLRAFLGDGRREVARDALRTVAELRTRDPNITSTERARIEALVATEGR